MCEATDSHFKPCLSNSRPDSVFCRKHANQLSMHKIYAKCHFVRGDYFCSFNSKDRTGYCKTHRKQYTRLGQVPPPIVFKPTKARDIQMFGTDEASVIAEKSDEDSITEEE